MAGEPGVDWVRRYIMENPKAERTLSSIQRLQPADLTRLLDKAGLSVIGSMEQLQRRMFRYELLGLDPPIDVPWSRKIDERGLRIPATTDGLQLEESREEVPLAPPPPPPKKPGRPRKNSTNSKTGRSGDSSASESASGVPRKPVTRSSGTKPKILSVETVVKGRKTAQPQPWSLEPRPAGNVAPPPPVNVANSATVSSTTRGSTVPSGSYNTPSMRMVREQQSRLLASASNDQMVMQNITQSTALMYAPSMEQNLRNMGLGILGTNTDVPPAVAEWLNNFLATQQANPNVPPTNPPQQIPVMPPKFQPPSHRIDVIPEESPIINQQSADGRQVNSHPQVDDSDSEFTEDEGDVHGTSQVGNSTVQEPPPHANIEELVRGVANLTTLLNSVVATQNGAQQQQPSEETPRARNVMAGGPRKHNQRMSFSNVAPPQINVDTSRQLHQQPDTEYSSDEEEIITEKKYRSYKPPHRTESGNQGYQYRDLSRQGREDRPVKKGVRGHSRFSKRDYEEEYSSDSDSAAKERKYRREREARQSKREWGKTLRDWVATFSGEGKVTLDDFILDIEEVKDRNAMTDDELLYALPRVLEGKAKDWYRRKRHNWTDWEGCKRALKSWFRRDFNDIELLSALVARSQGKEESISDFIFDVEKLIAMFKNPLSSPQLVALVTQNLTHEYRDYIEGKEVHSFEDILDLGLRLEKKNEINKKWKPPPAKSSIPGAAYSGPSKSHKSNVASLDADPAPETELATTSQAKPRRNKKSGQKNNAVAPSQNAEVAPQPPLATTEEDIAAYYSGQWNYGPFPQQQKPWQQPNYQQNNYQQRNYQQPPANNGYSRPANVPPVANNQAPAQTQPAKEQKDTKFYGSCHHCNGVGHRARECPQRSCFTCGLKGHYASECILRQMNPKILSHCQVCKRLNVIYDTCPNCQPKRENLGNEEAGRPTGPTPPTGNQ